MKWQTWWLQIPLLRLMGSSPIPGTISAATRESCSERGPAAQYKAQNCCKTCHPSQQLFDWNWAKNYPKSIPHGYVLKAFRLNSKHCLYAVDFNYRLNLTKDNYIKWMYRNPKCKLEGFFRPKDWKEWIYDCRLEYKGKLDEIEHRVDMDKVNTRDLKAMSRKAC